jgi:hypothetical protein
MDDLVNDHWLETYKSLITLAVESFKFAALANGGAAVALLAYLGNVAAKNGSALDMRWPMGCFVSGLALCGLSMVVAYFTQLKLLNEIRRSERPTLPHYWLLRLTILLFIFSLVAFGIGSCQAVIRFHP